MDEDKKFNKRLLEKHLGHLKKAELQQEIIKLYNKFHVVKEYYQSELGNNKDRSKVLLEYKNNISKQFFPKRGIGNPKNSMLRTTIQKYRKVAVFVYEIVDLILHRVECAIQFSNRYGYIDSAFYDGMANAFKEALLLIKDNILYQTFEDRALAIVQNAERAEWIMADRLQALFENFYKDPPTTLNDSSPPPSV